MSNKLVGDEQLVELAQGAMMISASENVIYPLLEKKIQNRLNLACARFANGETDFVGDIAYIHGLKELMQQLRSIQTQGNKAHHALSNKENN